MGPINRWIDRKAFRAKCGIICWLVNGKTYLVNGTIKVNQGDFVIRNATLIGNPTGDAFIEIGGSATLEGVD